MADTTGHHPYSGYGPGYGVTFLERLMNSVGRNVTVFIGEETAPVRGMLHNVGSNYVEVHRMAENVNEAVIIPMQAIAAIAIPMQHAG